MLRRRFSWPQGAQWLAGGIAATVLALALAWVLFVPGADWLARHDVGSAHGALLQTARDAARGRLLTLGAGLFAAGALAFTALTFTLSRRTFRLAVQGNVTDRYTKAVEQLGSDKLDVRIGGIYALARVARDSDIDHPAVMEVLTAFVRVHSREQLTGSGTASEEPEQLPRPDIQAALTVIGRRDAWRDTQPIDLTGADLTRVSLGGAILGGASLLRADLTEAYLRGVDLSRAILFRAVLTGAVLTGAVLTGVDFRGAKLTGARWPEDTPVPEGWRLDTFGRLEAASTDSGPAEAN